MAPSRKSVLRTQFCLDHRCNQVLVRSIGISPAPHSIQDIPNNQIWEKSDHVQRENKEMRYVLKIGQLTTTYDNFDDFVEALREEAEDREFNRHIDLYVKVTNLL